MWYVYADTLPLHRIDINTLKTLVYTRGNGTDNIGGVCKAGSIAALHGNDSVHLVCGHNRVCRPDDLTGHEKANWNQHPSHR